MRRIAAIVVGLLSLDLTAQSGQAREPPPVWSGAPGTKGTAGLAELAERARAAVVHVRGEMPDGSAAGESDSEGGRTSIGTGFIINKDGYILTNEHVVRGVIDLRVRLFDGRELAACVVGADIADRHRAAQGDAEAAAAGAAAGRLGRRARRRAGDRHRQPLRLQPQRHRRDRVGEGAGRRSGDAARAGAAGHLFVLHPDRRVDQPRQLGRAAHRRLGRGHRRQRRLLGRPPAAAGAGDRLRDPHQHGQGAAAAPAQTGTPGAYLGVDAQPLDPALEAALKLPSGRGALIASIEKGSPAEAAGLEPGDVVVNWNGAAVATSEDFKIDAQLSTPGARMKIALVRDGKRSDREIVPAGGAGQGGRATASVELRADARAADGQRRRLRRAGDAGAAGGRPGGAA